MSFVIRIVLTLGLLGLLAGFVDAGSFMEGLAAVDAGWFALSVLLLLAQLLLVALRWGIGCAALGWPLPGHRVLGLVFLGQFLNQLLPTSVGGDGARILVLGRSGWPWGQAATAVLADRTLGFLVMIVTAAAALAVAQAVLPAPVPQGGPLAAALWGAALAGVLLPVAIARHGAGLRLLRPAEGLSRGFLRLLSAPGRGPAILAAGFTANALTILSLAAGARAVGLAAEPVHLAIFAMVVLASVVPLTFAGWGVREGAMVTGLGLVGVGATEALLVSVLHGLAQILIGLPGLAAVWRLPAGALRARAPAPGPGAQPGVPT